MVIPNFSEGILIYKLLTEQEDIDDEIYDTYHSLRHKFRKEINGKYYTGKKYRVSKEIKHNVNLSEVSGLVNLFEILGVDLERFKVTTTIKTPIYTKLYEMSATEYEDKHTKEKRVRMYKTGKIKHKRKSFDLDYYALRESVITYLKWKVKDIKKTRVAFHNNMFFIDTYKVEGYDSFYITKELYLEQVNKLEELFKYHTSKISNATLEEDIDYNVKRLLNTEIVLVSHEEMRRNKNGNKN